MIFNLIQLFPLQRRRNDETNNQLQNWTEYAAKNTFTFWAHFVDWSAYSSTRWRLFIAWNWKWVNFEISILLLQKQLQFHLLISDATSSVFQVLRPLVFIIIIIGIQTFSITIKLNLVFSSFLKKVFLDAKWEFYINPSNNNNLFRYLHLRYNLGSGEVNIVYNTTKVSDGLWHRIRILR